MNASLHVLSTIGDGQREDLVVGVPRDVGEFRAALGGIQGCGIVDPGGGQFNAL